MSDRHTIIKHLDSAISALHTFLQTPRLCDRDLIGLEPQLRELQRQFEVATAFGQDKPASAATTTCGDRWGAHTCKLPRHSAIELHRDGHATW